MRITCDSCGRALELPDAKVPNRRFSVACPSCQHKIAVDPTATAPGPGAPGPIAPGPPAPGPPPQPAADAGELRPLRGPDRELLESRPMAAVIAHQDVAVDPRLETELQRLDFREIHHCSSLDEACAVVRENDVSLLLVHLHKASAPPCEPLEPIYRLDFEQRRSVFVALLADNVKTLDGQVAFYLQVNCLIATADVPNLAPHLRRALLHDLRLYRHWRQEE